MSLRLQDLSCHYGGVRALDGVNLEVAMGECVALIGPNGAGKSTCFACVAGQQRPTRGQVHWAGQDLSGLTADARLALGLARTFQVAQLFEALTVRENVQLAMSRAQLRWWDRLSDRARPQADAVLAAVDLQAQGDAVVAHLPYGAKKRLELALALAGWQSLPEGAARLLLLDEPAAGLAPAERAHMMALVRQVAGSGAAVLYTEHNMDAVFGVADRVVVLMQGQCVADGTPEAVAQDERVRRDYLGRAGAWPESVGDGHGR